MFIYREYNIKQGERKAIHNKITCRIETSQPKFYFEKLTVNQIKSIHTFLFSFPNIYLFIWLHRVLVAARKIIVAARRIFVATCGIFSCSMWDLFSVAACGIQFPDQGSNSSPLHREHGVFNLWTTREVPYTHFFIFNSQKNLF